MATTGRLRHWSRLGVHLGNNPISRLGAALTTASGITLLWFWLLEFSSPRAMHPYFGILLFIILPAIFALGLVLSPVGLLRRRAQLRKVGQLPTEFPRVDFHAPAVRNGLIALGGITVLNVAIMGTTTHKGMEYMDSNEFCGLACHKVMAPEYNAYLDTNHAHAGCASCHIGEGRGAFVRSKLSGVRQLISFTRNTYSRPIPSPVHNLRPASETCEHCHWPGRAVGDVLKVRKLFAEDEHNTPSSTILTMKVGGGRGE